MRSRLALAIVPVLTLAPRAWAGEPLAHEAALSALGAGQEAHAVAAAAGCADVAALEDWLFPPAGDFLHIQAGTQGTALRPGDGLQTPLRAELGRLRPLGFYADEFLPPSYRSLAPFVFGAGAGGVRAFDRSWSDVMSLSAWGNRCEGAMAMVDPRCPGAIQPSRRRMTAPPPATASGDRSRARIQRNDARARSAPRSTDPERVLPVRAR